jgi:2-dehydro-3-deoxy-D-gluconate 5-dehydrogenase
MTQRTALVTGGTGGIGSAIVRYLAGQGHRVATNYRDPGKAEAWRKAMAADGIEVCMVQGDVSDPVACEAMIRAIEAKCGPVDILVNNAGTIRRAPAAQHSDTDWDLVLQVNLHAQFTLTRAIGATMIERGSGKIIFTASLLSYQGGITVPGYTAAKHAITGLTKALANEWAPHGVNVNAIAPGYITTDNTQALQDDPQRNNAILQRIPAARWGTPDDLTGATIFLASNAANYIHGTTLPIDGGWLGR